MSKLPSKSFRPLRLAIWLSIILSHTGCSLIWNAESVDPPSTEGANCDNQYDDDGDGFVDCEDDDCAWSDYCLNDGRPYELALCAYGESQRTYGFDATSVTRLANACRDQEAVASFGGNRSVCGPPGLGSETRASSEYHLNDWNVLADSYCAQLENRIVRAQTCGDESGDFLRQCDAPALVCVDNACDQFALFLNGDRSDGTASGVVSRDIDLWSENTDFFEIDTVIKRLMTRLVNGTDDTTRPKQIVPCNAPGCAGACQMNIGFEPKEADSPGARLSLDLAVMDNESAAITYRVAAGVGSDVFNADERPTSGTCGQLQLQREEVGYHVRLSGPFYQVVDGRSLSTLVISTLEADGSWKALCGIPWQDNDGTVQETEYQLKYTRQGTFGAGKLLLGRVDVKRRRRTNGSRSLCGPSEIGIFQGGRTVCGRTPGVIDRVVTVNRYFEPEARRLVIGRSVEQMRYLAFQETDGVLYELVTEPESLPDYGDTIIGLSSVIEPSETAGSEYLMWVRREDNSMAVRRLLITDELEANTEEGGPRLRLLSTEAVNTSDELLASDFLNGPGMIFRALSPSPRYVALWMSDQTLQWAYSKNGVSNWVREFENPTVVEGLLMESALRGERIVDIRGFEVPMLAKDQPIQRVLLMLSTVDEEDAELTVHTATLVRDVRSQEKVSLFYHGEVLIEPVSFVNETDLSNLCEGRDCLDYSSQVSLTAGVDGHIVVYAKTRIDEQFRPRRGPQPEANCGEPFETPQPLPSEKIWRRILYRLK